MTDLSVSRQLGPYAAKHNVPFVTAAAMAGACSWSGAAARVRHVRIGQRGTLEAEVTGGLKVGERIVRHPSNDLEDCGRVRLAGAG